MAENVFDIGIGTEIDLDKLQKELKDGLSKAESEVIRSVQRQTETVNDAAQEQIKIIRNTEKEKIAEVKKGTQERIAAIKAMPGLDKSFVQDQIKAVKEAEQQKVKVIKDSAKLQEKAIKDMATKHIKQVNDLAKKQIKAIQDANKKSLQSIKEFAKGAASELLGIDQVLASIAGGPTAWGKLFVDAGKQIVSTLNQWAESARESIQVQDTLKAVIKSTGAETWVTASALTKLASEQSQATGRSRDEITQMQSVLLGFRSVTKDVFQDATSAILDMAQVMGGDLRGAANQLGKALDTPIEGMSALSRSGFVFTEQQKELVKQFVESGDLLSAQKIILGEVQDAFSGAATAVNPAIQAQVAYNNAVEDFKRVIGTGWAEAMSPVLDQMSKLISWYTKGIEGIQQLKTAGLEYARSRDFVDSLDEEIKALQQQSAAIRDSKEYQRILKEIRDAGIEGNEELAEQLQQQIILMDENGRTAVNNLREKKLASSEYQNVLENEMRLLEILKSMEEGGEVGVDFSIREQRIAENYKRMYERINGIRLNIDEQYAYSHELHQEALAAQERKRLEEQLKAENLANIQRQMSAEKYREENQKALDAEIEKIYRRAELEGKARGDLTVQKQILDANVQAYENLLQVAKDVIDGTAEAERKRFADLKDQWAAYGDQAELEKFTDAQRKQRLQELANLQKETLAKVTSIYEQANAEANKLYETAKEKAFQDDLLEIRKKSLKDAIQVEFEYRQAQKEQEKNQQLAILEENYNAAMGTSRALQAAELEAAGNNAEQKIEIERRYEEERARLHREYNTAVAQTDDNFREQRRQAELETVEAIKQANIQMWDEILSKAQEYLNAASSIANSISTIWTNNIEYETNEKLRANDKMIQSDEERAHNEEKIMKQAAYERYKAELFAWSTNVIMATAQSAMAILNALNTPPFPVGLAMAGLATAMGALNVASVISARPKPPRFHSGGQVAGRSGQEQFTNLQGKEVVMTNRQFKNNMQAIENLANLKGGGTQLNVKVINNAANQVSTQQQITPEGLEIVVTGLVNKGLNNGTFDQGLASQQQGLQGLSFTN